MEAWGKCALINLTDCDPDKIADGECILEWGRKLVDLIGMIAVGEPTNVRCAIDDAEAVGYSFVQIIETSNISAHFSERYRTVYIFIFSCKDFNTADAIDFSLNHFGGASYRFKVQNMMPDGRIL
jgi:S-adenosylmethionine/arginine decarboxylase-like enzyme